MSKVSLLMAAGLLAAASLFMSGCDKLRARDDSNQRVQAFRNA